ncbi:MAG: hypothetical protein K0S74_1702 [Chlamydiales bacterium]|nr:hypothetical protein [Chlamydiales bacterium]
MIAPTDEFILQDSIRKTLSRELRAKYSKNDIKLIFSDFFRKRTVRLVNPEVRSLIRKLAQRDIPVTALTAWWTGHFGTIPKMEELRLQGLAEVNISFMDISPFKEDCSFPDLKADDGVPMITNGIILTALVDKGIVLKAALNKANFKPNKIIFIDDNLSYVKSVEKICEELNIEFIGIHYTEASFIPLPQLDESKELLRFEVLEQEHIWLLDVELEERLRLKDK